LEKIQFFAFFKNNPLREIFQNSVWKRFITSLIDVLCPNFMEFGPREIGKIMRCLPDKKSAQLSSSHNCSDRTQNLPGPAPENVLRVLLMSSKSVHFWQSYTQTREYHQNGP